MTMRSADISRSRRSRPARCHTTPPGRSPGTSACSTALVGPTPLKCARSLAGGGCLVAAYALAYLRLADPARLDDDVQVVTRDRDGREQPRLELDLLLATAPLRCLVDGRPGRKRDGGARRLLPKLARV